jgi:hypothetical protein
MSEEKEKFLDRWSRLKEETAKEEEKLPVEKEDEPAPVLPPVEQLKPESEFKPFMDPRVDGETRRAALKKLFADAHFNLPDPYEPYSRDFNEDPIPTEMLRTLNHARRLLFDEKEQTKEKIEQVKEQTTEKPLPETKDGAGKQDA